ncbi:hypothetical protein LC55x_0041 [Lysobacter capsici]|nr:hypothetical protein LC55x_0041 [Lysobacter capsici]
MGGHRMSFQRWQGGRGLQRGRRCQEGREQRRGESWTVHRTPRNVRNDVKKDR